MRIGMTGTVHDGFHWARFHNVATVHDEEAIGYLIEDGQIVGDENRGANNTLIPKFHQEAGGKSLGAHIKGGSDLISNDQSGIENGGNHHDHPLLHTPRELNGVLVQHFRI